MFVRQLPTKNQQMPDTPYAFDDLSYQLQIYCLFSKGGIMKVLIADDSEILRDRIKESLRDLNMVEIIGEAKNGIEALKIIKEQKPDFILLDLRMPELNGFEVLKKIRENGYKPKVCIYTNYAYTQYKKRCIKEGADYFFDKNSDFEDVKNLIINLVQNFEQANDL